MALKNGMLRIKIRRVVSITVSWTVVAALDAINTHALSQNEYLVRTEAYQFGRYLLINMVSGAVAGVLSGSLLVFLLREWLRDRSFGFSLLINSLVISAINFAISALAFSWVYSQRYHKPIYDPQIIEETGNFFWSPFYLKNLLFWLMVVFFTLVFLNVNEKYGPGVFRKLLMGRYHRPREEERIFMFVDIRSSTAIAERLGHINFFNLLNDFFQDITNPIISHAGEIYQYVGDEVVISWSMEKGLSNANCIRCFYQMQEVILRASDRYREKYGIVPEFKAGLHCGPVTIGEIGVIKKDIVYSGDVMNTTSRIQSVCNKFRVKILLSKELLDRLSLPPHGFTSKRMGIIELKGKKQKVELYTFEESVDEEHPRRLARVY